MSEATKRHDQDNIARLRHEARDHRAQRKRLLELARSLPYSVARLRRMSQARERSRLAQRADSEAVEILARLSAEGR